MCVLIIFLEINSPFVLVQRASAKRITLSLYFFLLATKFSSVLVFSLRFLLLSIKDKEKKNECRMERGKHFLRKIEVTYAGNISNDSPSRHKRFLFLVVAE